MTTTKRQIFSTEFKAEAVKLAESIGVPKAAKELGILENNIRRYPFIISVFVNFKSTTQPCPKGYFSPQEQIIATPFSVVAITVITLLHFLHFIRLIQIKKLKPFKQFC